MKVRAKKSLGQHFLTDLSIAQRIAAALLVDAPAETAGRVEAAGGEVAQASDTAGRVEVAVGEVAQASDTAERVEAASGDGLQSLDMGAAAGRDLSGAAGLESAVAQPVDVLEVGPGTGVLTQYLLQRQDISLRMVELDREAVNYLLTTFPQTNGRLIEADFLRLRLENLFPGNFCIIGNFPYNISSQIFFKVLDYRDRVPQVVCMIQREVAERIAERPGSKTYGILSVLLQAWYDIEYLFSVGPGAFYPAPKVNSAVIRLRRNSRTELGCDESLFKAVVKTAFNQRRKTLRNSLKPLIQAKISRDLAQSNPTVPATDGSIVGTADDTNLTQNDFPVVGPSAVAKTENPAGSVSEEALAEAIARFTSDPVFDLRPERLSVSDFIALTLLLS